MWRGCLLYDYCTQLSIYLKCASIKLAEIAKVHLAELKAAQRAGPDEMEHLNRQIGREYKIYLRANAQFLPRSLAEIIEQLKDH